MSWFEWSDLITIALLVVLEGILSGDNALVLAVMVMPLPEDKQRKALSYGIIGAFVLRAAATLLAVYLAQVTWVSLLGGAYLLYLPFKHFTAREDPSHGTAEGTVAVARGILGLSLFWSTVLKVELTDLVFAVDSILVAVALTDKTWVIITGGVLGILMMRLLVVKIIALIRRYPKLIDGAYVVVLWVGIKLVWEFLHVIHWVPWGIPKWVAIGVTILLFVVCFLYARAHEDPAAVEEPDEREALFVRQEDTEPGEEGQPVYSRRDPT